MLPRFSVALRLLRVLNGFVEHRHQLGPPSQRIHGATLYQRFEDALIQQPQINLLAEFVERLESSQFFSGDDNRVNGIVSNILDCSQAEANRRAMRGEIGITDV